MSEVAARASTTRAAVPRLEAEQLLPMPEAYYAECNAVFRRCTTQSEAMLREVQAQTLGRRDLAILSVGSGVGLFELPLLRRLTKGRRVRSFVGLDTSQHACFLLLRDLEREFGSELEYQVVNAPFEETSLEARFDLILWNHVLEYLPGDPAWWVEKSLSLCASGGQVFVFSPDRGGINAVYEAVWRTRLGRGPSFSDDLANAFRASSLQFTSKVLPGECDVTLLGRGPDDEDGTRLLSFLAQTDCRSIPPDLRAALTSYFTSLRFDGSSIPHPTTLFVL